MAEFPAREFEAKCEKCGGDLDCEVDESRHGDVTITVRPCDKCLEEAKDAGVEEGRTEGE